MANPGLTVKVDTRLAQQFARRWESQARRAGTAIRAANTELAKSLQVREANIMLAEVAEGPGTGPRPQRHARGSSPLARALRDDGNRRVTTDGFVVNIPEFLDSRAIYWRQLELGAGSHTQAVPRGFFFGPRGFSVPNADLRGTGSRFTRIKSEARHSGAEPEFIFRVGPARPYAYIEQATDQLLSDWRTTKRATNTYWRAFAAEGLDLMARFQAGGSRGIKFRQLAERVSADD